MASNATKKSTPTLTEPAPPTINSPSPTGMSEPTQALPESLAAQLLEATTAEMRPKLLPPGVEGAAEAAAAAAGIWRTGVHVTALWVINEVRNGWMNVQGIGWRKLYNGRDGAFTALVTLASQARQTNRPITFREEADGMVYEIYLW